MSGKVLIGGVVKDARDAAIPVLDRGFLYGDAAVETLRVYGGEPFLLERHLGRLRATCARLRLSLPEDDAALAAAARRTLAAAGLAEAVLRLVVTRGQGGFGLDPAGASRPELVVMVLALPPAAAPLRAAVVSQRRLIRGGLDPAAKTANMLLSVLALAEAKERGANEAILLNERGEVAEASAANLFVWLDGSWCTPPRDAGILPGLTREVLLEAGRREGWAMAERVVRPEELARAAAIVATSSVREVVPVVAVDGAPIAGGEVPPAAAALADLYRGVVAGRRA